MKTNAFLFLLVCNVSMVSPARALDVSEHAQLQGFIQRLVSQHEFSERELHDLFSKVELRPRVVEAIQRPSERLPWFRYRRLFVTPAQVKKGVAFWNEHHGILEKAEKVYGVPASILVAIIGVETRYGSNKGSHPVIESLTTLTLQYPRRSKFFGSELEHFLLLTREEKLDPLAIKGSYAGAIGIPQFMPSSYRDYAVDFDKNGVRDLVDNTSDAIGSVGNYLKRYRWRAGKPIATVAEISDSKARKLVRKKLKPNTTVKALRAAGAKIDGDYPGGVKVGLLRLDAEKGHEYRVAFDNFYVITRYNPSVHYAMAVYELSQALAAGRQVAASR